MPETELKAHLLALARETLQVSQTSDSKSPSGREGVALYDRLAPGQGGRAFYNPMRDDRIIGLPSFAPAVAALEAIRSFLAVADSSEARRIVLQFIYDFLEWQTNANFDESAFAATWLSFQEELARPEWTYLSICYLDNFECDVDAVELGDGVTIHHRSSYEFRERGWSDFQIEKLYENWHGRGLYVLVVEEKVRKSPDNLILGSTGHAVSKADRMLRATARNRGRCSHRRRRTDARAGIVDPPGR